MSDKPVVYVLYDVTGKRYKVSVRASKTHASLADVTVQTLLKNMSAIVKEELNVLEIYNVGTGKRLDNSDRLEVGGTVGMRKVEPPQRAPPPVIHHQPTAAPPVPSPSITRSHSDAVRPVQSNVIDAAVQQVATSRTQSALPPKAPRVEHPPVEPPHRSAQLSRESSIESLHPPVAPSVELASSRFAPTGRAASSSRQSSVQSVPRGTWREEAETPVWNRGNRGEAPSEIRSSAFHGGGDGDGASENSEELRSKCNELSMMKDRLAAELANLTARIDSHSSQRRGDRRAPSSEAVTPQLHQMSPSRRFASATTTQSHFDTPQVMSSYNPPPQRFADPDPSAPTTRETAALDSEIHSLEQNIASLHSLMSDGAAEWAGRRRDLQKNIRDAKDARIKALKADLDDAVRRGREDAEQRHAVEDELAMVSRRLASSNGEADDRKASVDDATSRLDAIKEEIRRIIRSDGGSVEGEAELAQGIVASAAQLCKTRQAFLKEEAANSELRASFEELALERKHLHSELEDAKGHIRVVVRLRPKLSSDDLAPQAQGSLEDGALELDTRQKCVYVSTPTAGSRRYELYDVYGPARDSIQQQAVLFEEQVAPLLNSVFDGFNVAVLAYGQTGSGKTFTIIGETSEGTLSGLLPQSVEFLMHEMQTRKRHQNVTISLTMTELYMDTVYDLLHALNPSADAADPDAQRGGIDKNRKCEIRQSPGMDGVYVAGALEIELESWDHAMQIIHAGIDERQTHRTAKNSQSSRSHLILTLWVEMVTPRGLQKSKLVFCDLAGSERVSRSLSSGDRLKEAQHINKSLSSLGDILNALSTVPRPQHIPYRNSKLTQLLQSTLGGNSKTLMVACISPHIPSQHNLVETQSTLQFASRARLVRNRIQQSTSSHDHQQH